MFNLTVLLTPSMRTRSNMFLAVLAIADMIFLMLMIPHTLAHFDYFLFNYYFRYFYLTINSYLLAVINWASAAAIWLILTICVERLIGIRYPLSTRKRRYRSIQVTIISIFFVTGMLTVYNIFSHDCLITVYCSGTQVYGRCMDIGMESWPGNQTNKYSTVRKAYAAWSPKFNAVFVVFLPTLIILLSNVWLILTLHERRRFLQHSTRNHDEVQRLASGNAGTSNHSRNEQRITFTICAIVTCFTLTQAPSAVFHVIRLNLAHTEAKVVVGTVTNFMVCLGKSLNFLLFCMSSSSFRHKFMKLTKNRMNSVLGKRSTKSTNETMLTACTDRSRSPSPNLLNRSNRKFSAPQAMIKNSPAQPKSELSAKKSRSLKGIDRLKPMPTHSLRVRGTSSAEVNVSAI